MQLRAKLASYRFPTTTFPTRNLATWIFDSHLFSCQIQCRHDHTGELGNYLKGTLALFKYWGGGHIPWHTIIVGLYFVCCWYGTLEIEGWQVLFIPVAAEVHVLVNQTEEGPFFRLIFDLFVLFVHVRSPVYVFYISNKIVKLSMMRTWSPVSVHYTGNSETVKGWVISGKFQHVRGTAWKVWTHFTVTLFKSKVTALDQVGFMKAQLSLTLYWWSFCLWFLFIFHYLIITFSSMLSLYLTFLAVIHPPLYSPLPASRWKSFFIRTSLVQLLPPVNTPGCSGLLQLQHLQTKTVVICWPGFYVTWQQVRESAL